MSVTECRNCKGPITFVQNANGRWRPVEVTFEELELDGSEVLAVQQAGGWTQLVATLVRVYTAHDCPENPTWNRGRPRMRSGNEATGEVMDDSDEADSSLSYQEIREQEEVRNWLKQHPIDAKYPCRKCQAEAGSPCRNSYFGVAGQVHRERHIATFFDEDDETQPWPPTRENQRGLKIMREWLSQNAKVLTGEEE